MTRGRLGLYLSLTLWEGSIADTAWRNFLDGRWWPYLLINGVLLAGLVLAVALLIRHDRRAGRIVGADR